MRPSAGASRVVQGSGFNGHFATEAVNQDFGSATRGRPRAVVRASHERPLRTKTRPSMPQWLAKPSRTPASAVQATTRHTRSIAWTSWTCNSAGKASMPETSRRTPSDRSCTWPVPTSTQCRWGVRLLPSTRAPVPACGVRSWPARRRAPAPRSGAPAELTSAAAASARRWRAARRTQALPQFQCGRWAPRHGTDHFLPGATIGANGSGRGVWSLDTGRIGMVICG